MIGFVYITVYIITAKEIDITSVKEATEKDKEKEVNKSWWGK